jgi:hypothetical protein
LPLQLIFCPGNWSFAENSWSLATEQPCKSELEGFNLNGQAIGPGKASKTLTKRLLKPGKDFFLREKTFAGRKKSFAARSKSILAPKRLFPR